MSESLKVRAATHGFGQLFLDCDRISAVIVFVMVDFFVFSPVLKFKPP